MQIILKKSVPHLGLVGDVVNVAAGYYRNYLAPRELAFLANPKSLKQVEHQKRIVELKKQQEKNGADELKVKLESTPFKMEHAAGEEGRLFGSITNQEIVLHLKTVGFEVDRKLIHLDSPIKTLGPHVVKVKLHPEVVADLNLEVCKKQKKEESEATPTKISKKSKESKKSEETTEIKNQPKV